MPRGRSLRRVTAPRESRHEIDLVLRRGLRRLPMPAGRRPRLLSTVRLPVPVLQGVPPGADDQEGDQGHLYLRVRRFLHPGRSDRCVTYDECGKRQEVFTPTCGCVRTRKKLVKHEKVTEVPTCKCVVENMCDACSKKCAAQNAALRSSELAGNIPVESPAVLAASYQAGASATPQTNASSAATPETAAARAGEHHRSAAPNARSDLRHSTRNRAAHDFVLPLKRAAANQAAAFSFWWPALGPGVAEAGSGRAGGSLI